MSSVCPTCGKRRNSKRETESERSDDSVQREVGRLKDGDDMTKDILKDGNAYGCTLAASGDRILLQLDDCKDGEQVRVSLEKDEAKYLAHRLSTLVLCLPQDEPSNDKVSDAPDSAAPNRKPTL